jgi:hypothetical protein
MGNYTEMGLKEINVDRFRLAKDRLHWRSLVNMVDNEFLEQLSYCHLAKELMDFVSAVQCIR